jgi:hypothetical protein
MSTSKSVFFLLAFRAKDAKEDVLALGNKRNEELKSALPEVYLHRDKDKVLENFLPSKTQTVRNIYLMIEWFLQNVHFVKDSFVIIISLFLLHLGYVL